jgi:hypothetical protein
MVKSGGCLERCFTSWRLTKEAEIIERASAAGSCSHVLEDTAEVRGIECGWVFEREERDHDRSVFCGKGEEFHGRELLGQRLLCVHGGSWMKRPSLNTSGTRKREEERHEQLKTADAALSGPICIHNPFEGFA